MDNIVKIPVGFLKVGMYVAKLDRPWLETQYELEGLWISSPQDITNLNLYCDSVYVDPVKSCLKFPNLRVFFDKKSKFRYKRLETKTLAEVTDEQALPTPIEDEIDNAREIYTETSSLYLSIIDDLKHGKVIDLDSCQSNISGMMNSIKKNPDALTWLSILREKNNYAYQHSINVAIIMLMFGKHLKLPEHEQMQLGQIGLLQDVGKAALPKELMAKEGQLNAEESELIKQHVKHSVESLSKNKNIDPVVIRAISEHHERFNGSGYPKGLKSKQISFFGCISAIGDSYDAMLSERPGGIARSPYNVITILHDSKNELYHPALVERFIQCVGLYSPGSIVELNSGEVGIVVEQNQIRRLKPKILVILSEQKSPLTEPFMLDLLLEPVSETGLPYKITTIVEPSKYHINPSDYYL